MSRLTLSLALLAACSSKSPPVAQPAPAPAPVPETPVVTPAPDPAPAAVEPPPPPPRKHDAITRTEFNRWAVRENLPVYWTEDTNQDGNLDPTEVAPLLFYPTSGSWFSRGMFTRA